MKKSYQNQSFFTNLSVLLSLPGVCDQWRFGDYMSFSDHGEEERIRRIVREEIAEEREQRLYKEARDRAVDRMIRVAREQDLYWTEKRRGRWNR